MSQREELGNAPIVKRPSLLGVRFLAVVRSRAILMIAARCSSNSMGMAGSPTGKITETRYRLRVRILAIELTFRASS